MPVQAPPPVSFNPLARLAADRRIDRRLGRRLPPGPDDYSVGRTLRFVREPLPILLDGYHRFGPVFTVRVLHVRGVFLLGPAANHFVTVSHADAFSWREGSLGDLIPFLGDGMLTIDGAYHRRARRIMLPMFHRERVAATVTTMMEEGERALAPWSPGDLVDVYAWARTLALRIAMRALFGFDPDRALQDVDMAHEFEAALGFYAKDYVLQTLRGPGTPFGRLMAARRRLDGVIYAEIARRRRSGERREDLLSLLLDARDEDDGSALSDREVRDQVMTLLFAGHDTSTSTLTFLFYELAKQPAALARVCAEQDRVLGGRAPTGADLAGGLPELDLALDETLRLYPPAWIGPRRAIRDTEFAGHAIPAGTPVNYCSWASHRLPEVFPDPEAFVPDRFAPAARAALPKGAYVPFGGGSRTCLGMRFGQTEIKLLATLALQRFRLELAPGYELSVRQMPTLSPRGGMPMFVRPRGVPGDLGAVTATTAVPTTA